MNKTNKHFNIHCYFSLHYVCTCLNHDTEPIHLSTLQTEWTKLYRNSLFRNEPHKILGLGSIQKR